MALRRWRVWPPGASACRPRQQARKTVTGKGEMRAVRIDPAAIDPEDIGMLEDMICLATNNARAEADTAMAAKMKDITGGLPLPPGMSLPF